MSGFNFLSLYKEKQKSHETFQVGEHFPVPGASGILEGMFCFISLTCSYCIDLMPHLNRLSDQISCPLVLLCSGEHEEILEAADHFSFQFEWIAARSVEFEQTYRVFETPFIYYVEEGKVAAKQSVDSSEQFEAFIRTSVRS